jgi:hypothetical protein
MDTRYGLHSMSAFLLPCCQKKHLVAVDVYWPMNHMQMKLMHQATQTGYSIGWTPARTVLPLPDRGRRAPKIPLNASRL